MIMIVCVCLMNAGAKEFSFNPLACCDRYLQRRRSYFGKEADASKNTWWHCDRDQVKFAGVFPRNDELPSQGYLGKELLLTLRQMLRCAQCKQIWMFEYILNVIFSLLLLGETIIYFLTRISLRGRMRYFMLLDIIFSQGQYLSM